MKTAYAANTTDGVGVWCNGTCCPKCEIFQAISSVVISHLPSHVKLRIDVAIHPILILL